MHIRITRGDILHEQGGQADALSNYREALTIWERLAVAHTDGDRQWGVGLTLGSIGDALKAQGKVVDAVASYRAAVASYEKLDPSNTAHQGGHWSLHIKIAQYQGDLAGALAAYRASQGVAEHLVNIEPGKYQYLATSRRGIGDVLRKQGKFADAVESYRAALAINEELLKAEPGDTKRQQNPTLTHLYLARVLWDQRDFAGALASYEAALAILGKMDPADADWQGVLSEALANTGGVLQDEGNLAGALERSQAGLAVNERLHAAWSKFNQRVASARIRSDAEPLRRDQRPTSTSAGPRIVSCGAPSPWRVPAVRAPASRLSSRA